MSDSRARVLLRIPAKLKARLSELAEREHRSLNKQIESLLERAIEEENARDAYGSRRKPEHKKQK
jgi:hypothetical protein